MNVPFLDLRTQYHSIKDEIDTAVLKVLESTAYASGPFVEEFEKNYATAHDVAHCVAVNSGTSALHLALLALGVGQGDEVIIFGANKDINELAKQLGTIPYEIFTNISGRVKRVYFQE